MKNQLEMQVKCLPDAINLMQCAAIINAACWNFLALVDSLNDFGLEQVVNHSDTISLILSRCNKLLQRRCNNSPSDRFGE